MTASRAARPPLELSLPPDATRVGERRALAALLPLLWPKDAPETRRRVVLALLCLVLAKGAGVTIPLWFKGAVDALSQPPDALTVPVGLVIAYALARVTALGFGELRDAVFTRVEQGAIRKAGLGVFRHLHALSLRFHLERQTGGLSRSLERGAKAIQTILSYSLFSIIPTLVEIALVAAILAVMVGWRFSAAILLTVAIYIAYTFFISEWRTRFRREMNETDGKANTKAIDSLLNYETVKYFGNEDHEARRYDDALRRHEDAAVRSEQTLGLLNTGQSLIVSVGLAVVMLMAAQGIADGRLTLGDFILVNTYLLQLYQPLNFFGMVYREIKQSLTDLEAMFTLLTISREVADAPDAPALRIGGGEVRFEDVSFGYDSRRPILKGVSFTAPAGKTVAIVGASGAGKSTIGRLLFRFYDAGDGRLTIDGQDVRSVTQSSLRAAVGIVPQDTVLFNDTIYYNIAYGRPAATREEVERAAKLAHIHDFVVTLPDGYETMVGERGLKLSGGEKQRVAIARTILKNPPILLFDEATSALDTHTEREIQTNLAQLSEGRTTLVIAHRLSTVIGADEIIVLDQGRIVERGRHAALLSADGAYAALWRRQQQAVDSSDQTA
jgi:ATP-binding cassette, subfamily B, heavy metal transporter